MIFDLPKCTSEHVGFQIHIYWYSSLLLIRTSLLPKKSVLIREVSFGARENHKHSQYMYLLPTFVYFIEGCPLRECPLRERPLYTYYRLHTFSRSQVFFFCEVFFFKLDLFYEVLRSQVCLSIYIHRHLYVLISFLT